jgi:hypothetical protein
VHELLLRGPLPDMAEQTRLETVMELFVPVRPSSSRDRNDNAVHRIPNNKIVAKNSSRENPTLRLRRTLKSWLRRLGG